MLALVPLRGSFVVIARSKATKQSRIHRIRLNCFTALAMTRRVHRRYEYLHDLRSLVIRAQALAQILSCELLRKRLEQKGNDG